MKYWTQLALRNKFRKLARRMDRVASEFELGHPDTSACDQLLRSIRQDLDEIITQRKELGWPE